MEPYRPFVDKLVVEIMDSGEDITELSKTIKAKLLGIPVLEVIINNQRSPLMVAVGLTTASLAKCYAGEGRKIVYPNF
jgi:CRISPR-associated protein Cas1